MIVFSSFLFYFVGCVSILFIVFAIIIIILSCVLFHMLIFMTSFIFYFRGFVLFKMIVGTHTYTQSIAMCESPGSFQGRFEENERNFSSDLVNRLHKQFYRTNLRLFGGDDAMPIGIVCSHAVRMCTLYHLVPCISFNHFNNNFFFFSYVGILHYFFFSFILCLSSVPFDRKRKIHIR